LKIKLITNRYKNMTIAKTKRKRNLRKLWEDVTVNGKRPPTNEKVWFDEPLIAFLFAKYKKGKPFSAELEKLFYGNVQAIYNYVYWVVHDLGLERPEHLNNYMIANSLSASDKEQEWIDLYFEKIENKKNRAVK